MTPRPPGLGLFSLVAALVVAVTLALSVPTSAASPPASPATQTLPGLGPMLDGAAVPAAWLPPGADTPDDGPSAAIFPAQRVTVRFSHKRHAAIGVLCTTCHDRVTHSDSAADRLLPAPTVCDGCHGSESLEPRRRPSGRPSAWRVWLLPPRLRPSRRQPRCKARRAAREHELPARQAPGTQPEVRAVPRRRRTARARDAGPAPEDGGVPRVPSDARFSWPPRRQKLLHDVPPARAWRRAAAPLCGGARASGGRMRTVFTSGVLKPPRWMHDARAHARTGFSATARSPLPTPSSAPAATPRTTAPTATTAGSGRAASTRATTSRCTPSKPGWRPSAAPSCHEEQSFCLTCHMRARHHDERARPGFGRLGRFHPPKVDLE